MFTTPFCHVFLSCLFFSCHVSLLPYIEVYDSLLLIGLARLLFLLVYSWFCFTNTLFFFFPLAHIRLPKAGEPFLLLSHGEEGGEFVIFEDDTYIAL